MEIKIDQEIQNWMPPLSQDEYRYLEQQVLREGCKYPLVLWGGVLIDGHNRYKICTGHGIPFETEEKHFDTRDDAREWVIVNQIGRRNVAPGARVEMVRWMKKRVAERAKERQGERTDLNIVPKSAQCEKTRDVLAKLAGVGHDTFTKSEYVLDRGTEEQKQRLRTGEAKPHTLYTEIKLAEAKEKGITTQKCSHCGIEKPVEEFDGGRTRCNTCKSQKSGPKPKPNAYDLDALLSVDLGPGPADKGPLHSIWGDSPSDIDRIKLTPEQKEEAADMVVNQEAIRVTDDIKVLEKFVRHQTERYVANCRRLLSNHSADVLAADQAENRQRVIDLLDKAETSIRSLKELLK